MFLMNPNTDIRVTGTEVKGWSTSTEVVWTSTEERAEVCVCVGGERNEAARLEAWRKNEEEACHALADVSEEEEESQQMIGSRP